MSYYNLEQTLKKFQTSLPETLLPFDLPQLADLCKREEITPVFPYDKYINVSLGNDHELPTYLKELKEPFNGYLTLPELTNLILQPTKVVNISTAYIYEEIGKISKGKFVSLENYGYDRFEDYSDGHNSYCSGDINCIGVENLLFPIEQVQTYISLKQNNELDKLISPATTGTFGNPTVAHGEDKTYEQLVEALTAANAKIKQQKEDIKKLNNQSKEQADKHLYDWETMDKNQYPPELHLAMEIWREYYQVADIGFITQFNTGKFNKITNSLKLKDGNLKERIRTLLTPLERKLKAPSLIESFKVIDIIYTDKLEQD